MTDRRVVPLVEIGVTQQTAWHLAHRIREGWTDGSSPFTWDERTKVACTGSAAEAVDRRDVLVELPTASMFSMNRQGVLFQIPRRAWRPAASGAAPRRTTTSRSPCPGGWEESHGDVGSEAQPVGEETAGSGISASSRW